MSESAKPKLDFKYALNPYYTAINKYFIRGDVRDLANLIRKENIPEAFREVVAQIIEGDIKHEKASKGIAKSYEMKRFYEKLIANAMPVFFNMVKDLVASGDLPKDRLDNLKPNYGRKEIVQFIANEFYKGDCEIAGRIIRRKIKEQGWKPLPDF